MQNSGFYFNKANQYPLTTSNNGLDDHY